MINYYEALLGLSDYYGYHFNVECDDLPGDKMNEVRGAAFALSLAYERPYNEVFVELKRNVDVVVKKINGKVA